MILRFFLDIVNDQEVQQIIIKLIIGLVIKPIQVKEIYNGLSAMFQNDASVSTMKTRSKTLPQINWDYCNFCKNYLNAISCSDSFLIVE
jgi:hypothetical protein